MHISELWNALQDISKAPRKFGNLIILQRFKCARNSKDSIESTIHLVEWYTTRANEAPFGWKWFHLIAWLRTSQERVNQLHSREWWSILANGDYARANEPSEAKTLLKTCWKLRTDLHSIKWGIIQANDSPISAEWACRLRDFISSQALSRGFFYEFYSFMFLGYKYSPFYMKSLCLLWELLASTLNINTFLSFIYALV